MRRYTHRPGRNRTRGNFRTGLIRGVLGVPEKLRRFLARKSAPTVPLLFIVLGLMLASGIGVPYAGYGFAFALFNLVSVLAGRTASGSSSFKLISAFPYLAWDSGGRPPSKITAAAVIDYRATAEVGPESTSWNHTTPSTIDSAARAGLHSSHAGGFRISALMSKPPAAFGRSPRLLALQQTRGPGISDGPYTGDGAWHWFTGKLNESLLNYNPKWAFVPRSGEASPSSTFAALGTTAADKAKH